jgi:hypothetical protein
VPETAALSALRSAAIYEAFYRVERVGAVLLSDGGGPFGFDITIAFQVDYIVAQYRCDALVETGCFLGDTTAYLAAVYPDVPVITCDVNPAYANFVRARLAEHRNLTVETMPSPQLVADVTRIYRRPFLFLDAHWIRPWPLPSELAAIERGIVAIHDFDIEHPRFGFDSYDGIPCDRRVLAQARDDIDNYWTPDVEADYPAPCLQTGRRAGVAYLPIGIDDAELDACPYLRRNIVRAI